MTKEQFLKNLSVPETNVDVVIDTDAYNEIDDQFAIAYLIRSTEKLNTKALYAAPFYNENSTDPFDGMKKSYEEIKKILHLLEADLPVYEGSCDYLKDEYTPVISEAATDLVNRAKNYTPENPLYVVAIGAITNIASALLIDPSIAENIVISWLGGHSYEYCNTHEFNMYQDVAASRVVMQSGVPLVQLPCQGVVSGFSISKPELEYWLKGKNKISDYLCEYTIEAAESYAKGKPWTRVVWDVTAVAWLLNDGDKFMNSRIVNTRLSDYNNQYEPPCKDHMLRYVYYIKRDELMNDMIAKLTGNAH